MDNDCQPEVRPGQTAPKRRTLTSWSRSADPRPKEAPDALSVDVPLLDLAANDEVRAVSEDRIDFLFD